MARTAGKPTKSPAGVRSRNAATAAKQPYGAPALEKGLDVLELLSGLSHGVTQSEIAQLLGRSLQEVYRVVVALDRRGYIQRLPGEDGYVLSSRLHELAHRHPPMARLLTLATPALNTASAAAYQAFHIAILDHLDIRVVAQVDSPAPLGFRLRVGTKNPAIATASGRLLTAFQKPEIKAWILHESCSGMPEEQAAGLKKRIEKIHSRGYEMITGEGLQGITDVSFPLLDSSGYAQAVLTMPYLPEAMQRVTFDQACETTLEAARTISMALGGRFTAPPIPLARINETRPPVRPT